MAPITFNNAGKAGAVNPDPNATPAPGTGTTPTTTTTTTTGETGTTDGDRSTLQAELDKIHTTMKEQSQYLSQTDMADLDKLETLVQGYLAVLDQIDAGHVPNSGTGDAGVPGNAVDSANFTTGWNGPAQIQKGDGTYDNIILPENTEGVVDANGKQVSNGILLKLDGDFGGGKKAVSVTGKNLGNDIVVTIEFDDGTHETDLLKGMVTMSTPLIIAGDHTTDGFTVNFSQVKRVGNNDPKKPDLIILGGSGKDTLIGSQGNNQIIANGGDDFLQGGLSGSVSTLDGGDGDDTIKSYSDLDTITGGAGHDIVTKTGDNKGASQYEEISDIQTTALDGDSYFTGKGWSGTAKADGSELVVSQTNPPAADGGEINLTVPNGYMAYGKADGPDLVVTMQSINEDGTIDADGTKVVRLKGVLSTSSQAKINITSDSDTEHPGVIDFGGVNTQFNKVTIKKGLGSDVIIAPKTALDGYGVSAKDIGVATIDPSTASKIEASMVDAITKGPDYKPWASKPTVSGSDITFTPNKDQTDFDITPLPDGYQGGVIQKSADGKEYTITMFIKATGSTTTDSLVIHVMITGGNPQNVTVSNATLPSAAEAVKLLGSDGDDVGGIFVGSKDSTDTSKAATDKNKFIG